MKIILTPQEIRFIEMAKTATVISLGMGSPMADDPPRVEIPGKIVINYEELERPAMIWKMAIQQHELEKGDF